MWIHKHINVSKTFMCESMHNNAKETFDMN
jgi:hypothetical protein